MLARLCLLKAITNDDVYVNSILNYLYIHLATTSVLYFQMKKNIELEKMLGGAWFNSEEMIKYHWFICSPLPYGLDYISKKYFSAITSQLKMIKTVNVIVHFL